MGLHSETSSRGHTLCCAAPGVPHLGPCPDSCSPRCSPRWIVVAEALHHGAMLAQLQGREEGSDGRRLLMLIVRHRHGREHGRSAGTRYAGRAYYGRGQCSPTWGRCSPTWGHGWPACNPTPRLALPACNPNGAPPPTVRGLLWGSQKFVTNLSLKWPVFHRDKRFS